VAAAVSVVANMIVEKEHREIGNLPCLFAKTETI